MPRRDPLQPVCGQLGQTQAHGPVDVCRLPHGHEGPHKGAWHDLTWTQKLRREPRPHEGGHRNPIHNLPPQPGEERWR